MVVNRSSSKESIFAWTVDEGRQGGSGEKDGTIWVWAFERNAWQCGH